MKKKQNKCFKQNSVQMKGLGNHHVKILVKQEFFVKFKCLAEL